MGGGGTWWQGAPQDRAFLHRAMTRRRMASLRSALVVPRHRALAASAASTDRSSRVSWRIRATPPRRPHRESAVRVRTPFSLTWAGTY